MPVYYTPLTVPPWQYYIKRAAYMGVVLICQLIYVSILVSESKGTEDDFRFI